MLSTRERPFPSGGRSDATTSFIRARDCVRIHNGELRGQRRQQHPDTADDPSTGGGGTGTTNVTIIITGQGGKLAFTPNPATIAQGQLVVFKNNDTIAHHVMLDDGTVQTPDIAPGATSAAVAMGLSGATTYHCTIHPAWSAGSTARWRSLRRTATRPTASAVGNPATGV